jgi:hypothetical protein
MNRAIVQGEMESATAVDTDTMKYLRSIQNQRADFYMTRLQDYLLIGRGQNKFPDYLSSSTIDGMLPNKQEKYVNGIYLNKVSRTGYAYKNLNMPVYSEIEHENPPCQDCY